MGGWWPECEVRVKEAWAVCVLGSLGHAPPTAAFIWYAFGHVPYPGYVGMWLADDAGPPRI